VNTDFDFGLGYPPFTNIVDMAQRIQTEKQWKLLYDMCDNTLRSFLGVIGAKSPKTKFVVYSRGTDVNWTSEKFRAEWKKDLEERFPWLKAVY
jgi:hypothetical protein